MGESTKNRWCFACTLIDKNAEFEVEQVKIVVKKTKIPKLKKVRQPRKVYDRKYKEKIKSKRILSFPFRKRDPLPREVSLYRRNQRRKKKYYLDMKDPMFRLSRNLSHIMYLSLKKGKSGKSWSKLVNYSLEELKKHLENQFKDGMRWDNYGSEWQVDHIIPRSFFKFQVSNNEEFKKCWSLNNLQPLFTKDNLIKSNKILLPAYSNQPRRLVS